MDAAVMSFHLALSSTSSLSPTRFRPVVMPCNDRPALFRSFSTPSNHLSFGRPHSLFPAGFQLCTMYVHLSLFILVICPYHFILLFLTVFSTIFCPVLARISMLLTLSVYLMRNMRLSHRFLHAFTLFSKVVVKLQVSLPYSKIGITAALSSLSFIAKLISCLLKTFFHSL